MGERESVLSIDRGIRAGYVLSDYVFAGLLYK
jgi:hypothetical protein